MITIQKLFVSFKATREDWRYGRFGFIGETRFSKPVASGDIVYFFDALGESHNGTITDFDKETGKFFYKIN